MHGWVPRHSGSVKGQSAMAFTPGRLETVAVEARESGIGL
jgi:hypothetical protein